MLHHNTITHTVIRGKSTAIKTMTVCLIQVTKETVTCHYYNYVFSR